VTVDEGGAVPPGRGMIGTFWGTTWPGRTVPAYPAESTHEGARRSHSRPSRNKTARIALRAIGAPDLSPPSPRRASLPRLRAMLARGFFCALSVLPLLSPPAGRKRSPPGSIRRSLYESAARLGHPLPDATPIFGVEPREARLASPFRPRLGASCGGSPFPKDSSHGQTTR
jgi:hypothetical protein